MITIICKKRKSKRTLPPFFAKSISIDIARGRVKGTFLQKDGYENLLDHYETATGIPRSEFLVEYKVDMDAINTPNSTIARPRNEIDAIFRGESIIEETYKLLDEDAFML